MSREGRAAHARNQARHSQRSGGDVKRKLEPIGSDTLWLPEFLSSAQGIGAFSVNSLICLPLGETAEERELKLRKAASMGVLRMYAYRDSGQFVEYRWELA